MRILGKPPAPEFKDLISGLVKAVDDINEIERILSLSVSESKKIRYDDIYKLLDHMYDLMDILETIDHEYDVRKKDTLNMIISELEKHTKELEKAMIERPSEIPIGLIHYIREKLIPVLKITKRLIISMSRDPEYDNAGEKRSIKRYIIDGVILVLVTILANTK